MKIYLSIPISGRDIDTVKKDLEYVKSRFDSDQEVISPLDFVDDYNRPWIDYIIQDLKMLSECDTICIIHPEDNCGISYGMEIEKLAAEKLGLKIMHCYL